MGVLGYEPSPSRIVEEPARGVRNSEAVIREIVAGSPAEEAGFGPGDRILSINGEPVRDAIDLLFHGAESEIEIRLRPRGDERIVSRRLRQNPDRELGIVLEDFAIRLCNNQCVFCFVHQNPRRLRRGIYIKDGDFRMSFLHGNYITMTNMDEADFERIERQRLSPMYVSVHATDHALRLRMLGVKRGPDVLECLRRLIRGRIEFHTQIVLCPGWNDGEQLERTIGDLAALGPRLLSIAVVPLGMTEHRGRLPRLEPVTPNFCRETIAQLSPIARRLKDERGQPILFLADEFYVVAGRKPPSYRGVTVLHQLENGVGMVAEFLAPWRSLARRLPHRVSPRRNVALLTGLLGAKVLREPVERLNEIEGLRVDVIPCLNSLFGRSITVSGLLSGADFSRSISENAGYDLYLIPGNAVRAEGECFLDDMTLDELARRAPGPVAASDGDIGGLLEAIMAEDGAIACGPARRS